MCVCEAVFRDAADEKYIEKRSRKSTGKWEETHTHIHLSVPPEKQLPKLAGHVPLIMLASHSCPGSLSPAAAAAAGQVPSDTH